MQHTPSAGVGAVVIKDGKVLLVKRARPPYAGLWCIPGGKVMLGESLQQAAEREIMEETSLMIQAGNPVYAFDVIDTEHNPPTYHYVVIDLEASYVSGEAQAQDDALDVRWFTRNELMQDDVQQRTRDFLLQWWRESS